MIPRGEKKAGSKSQYKIDIDSLLSGVNVKHIARSCIVQMAVV